MTEIDNDVDVIKLIAQQAATITQLQAEAVERAAEVERKRQALGAAAAYLKYMPDTLQDDFGEIYANPLFQVRDAGTQPPSPGFAERVLALAKAGMAKWKRLDLEMRDYHCYHPADKGESLVEHLTRFDFDDENIAIAKAAQALTPDDIKLMGVE